MSQLFGPISPADADRGGDTELVPSTGMRALPAPPIDEQAFFNLDIKRSLQLHWRLARAVAIAFVALAVMYFLAQAFWLKSWPAYKSESMVYVQPTPAKVLPNQGGSPRWPFDSNTYETYIQQQMMNVSRQDVLIAALHKLDGFQRPGENDQSAALRLVKALEVTRVGEAYQFSISARAGDPAMAAQIANAVTAAYIESASRDEQTGDTQRLSMLKEEKERIQTALASDRTEQDALNAQLGVASVGTAVPDHYDEDITQIRTELAKARTDHDAAEAKFAALGAGHGPSSAAIDAAADEMIASDAGLVSMKTALNTRRAVLISQMANLTPLNPQYKQDEAELTKINGTLDAMLKDLREKAAARIQLQLNADLHRTGGVEAQLNGQLRQLVGAATSATPKMQRASDLAADITRLQARYATVDEQLHNLLLEDSAPAAAYQVTPAVPPLGRTKSGVLRNAVLIAFAGLFFGILAAVLTHKIDPRIYTAADVEQVLGFAPLAQLPNFTEVSSGAAEEYMLRVASAIEHGRKEGNLKNCIFTGAGAGTGVTTLVNRVGEMLEAMGRPTVLVDATGAQAPSPRANANRPESSQSLVPVERVIRPTALLQKMAEETETEEGSLVLTDTAPLAVSAETEYLARYVDCAIVVIESGVTTREELREAARTLQRLKVGAVGFVLNRVGLAKADPAFRASVEAVEKHLRAQSGQAARRKERSSSILVEPLKGRETLPQAPSTRSMFEPELAAAAAAVARFSPPQVSRPLTAPPVCLASPMASAPVSETVKGISMPLVPAADSEPPSDAPIEKAVDPGSAISTATIAEAAAEEAAEKGPVSGGMSEEHTSGAKALIESVGFVPGMNPRTTAPTGFSAGSEAVAVAEPAVEATTADVPAVDSEPVSIATPKASAPFMEAAKHFSSTPSVERAIPFSPRVVAPAVSDPAPIAKEEPVVAAVAETASPSEPEPAEEPKPLQPVTNTAQDIPWWLSDAPRNAQPARPPVLWQPAKVWTARQPSSNQEAVPDAPIAKHAEPQPSSTADPALERVPPAQESANVEATPGPAAEQASADRTSRLSGLRNLLFVLGVKDLQSGEESSEPHSGRRSDFDLRNERTVADSSVGGASPRLVTAPPEFLPPKPVVIEFDKAEARLGESSMRQDRRPAADRVEILPSKRGQYKKL
jgi:uncharacterized protein involved in exopolysaccharide biosynthesis